MPTSVEFTNLSDFLKASPFDAEYDLNHTLTTDLFWDQLHVRSDRLDELTLKLREIIDSGLEPNRVVFIKGYAGNGKTTLLHWFIRSNPDERHIYFDLQRRTMSEDDSPDEIKLLLNRHLRSMNGVDETLEFIYANRDVLEDAGFISYRLYDYLSTAEGPAIALHLGRVIDRFELKDTFACFFVHLFRTGASGRKTIVYYDNLDVARMEYLTDRFLVFFQDALSAALHISRHDLFAAKEIRFRSDYRFVFSLREPNDAILNAHLGDRLGFVRTPFMISFDAEHYQNVAEARIQFVQENFPDQDLGPRGRAGLVAFLRAAFGDTYVQDVFLPLYNHDYREVAGLLVNILRAHEIVERDGKLDYEIRGTLMFGIVENLLNSDFLRRYMRIIPEPDQDGYCYIDRVMLTVLINRSGYRRGRPQDDSSEPESLLYLVKDLNLVYQNIPIILDSIATCFLAHKQNRIHLVTVLNRRIDNLDFIPTYTELVERALSDDDSIETAKIRNELKSILVRVNPAGFTLVRYILPHFEFYSNLVGNTHSLFHQPLKKVTVADEIMYAFEEKIDKVLKQVRRHIGSMKTFFDKRYLAEGITPEKFARSCYCFRHPGRSLLAKATGHSHTIKIITAHIDYIDTFRVSLLRYAALDEEQARFMNESLVTRIRKYVDLLKQALDRDVAVAFEEQFDRAIKAVVRSGYTDRETRIEREGGRARDEA